MCLEIVDKKEITNKIKNSIDRNGIKVYKVVSTWKGKYAPLYQNITIPFKINVKTNVDKAITKSVINACTGDIYQAGFHFFLKKEDAEEYKDFLVKGGRQFLNSNTKVIECIIKKSWITATGKNTIRIDYTGLHTGKTIVTNKAIFPIFAEKG